MTPRTPLTARTGRWLIGMGAVFILLAGFSGCASMQPVSRVADLVPQAAPWWLFGVPDVNININVNGTGNVLQRYVKGRFNDFLDIFEIGFGWGLGLGAQVSPLIGFVGIEGGQYTWWGIFGHNQIGVVRDNSYFCNGVPLSVLAGFGVLFGGGPGVFGQSPSLLNRVGSALLVMLGYEDGIGGMQVSASGGELVRSGNHTIGPLAVVGTYNQQISSGSGPIGGSVAIGPLAVMARVRAGAIINFVFGFIGWHPFYQPSAVAVYGVAPTGGSNLAAARQW